MLFNPQPLRNAVKRTLLRRIALPLQVFRTLPVVQPNRHLRTFNRNELIIKQSNRSSFKHFHTTPILAEIVKVPPFAESVNEGDVKFTVKVGDTVAQDDNVMEIETDKTTVPVPAPKAGTITEIYVADGDTVKPGQDLFKIE